MTDEKNPYRADANAKDQLTWWQLMWKNGYVQLFGVAIAFLVVELICMDEFYSWGAFIVGISIPIGMMVVIAVLGFWKFWKQYSAYEKEKQKNEQKPK